MNEQIARVKEFGRIIFSLKLEIVGKRLKTLPH
jgi:hypothetical protein